MYRSLTSLDINAASAAKATAASFVVPKSAAAATSTTNTSSNTSSVDGSAASSAAAAQPIFGAELGALEHKELPSATVGGSGRPQHVPRFVVECVRFIERPDNLRTHGIYRASGKKENIDRLKRKMNKPSKPYEMIEGEDVHVITAGLKQFFRELRTALISSQLVERLPNNLGEFEEIRSINWS